MQEAAFVEVQRVFQVDLLHVFVGGTTDTDHVERVSVQVEGMRQVRLLYCNRGRGDRRCFILWGLRDQLVIDHVRE